MLKLEINNEMPFTFFQMYLMYTQKSYTTCIHIHITNLIHYMFFSIHNIMYHITPKPEKKYKYKLGIINHGFEYHLISSKRIWTHKKLANNKCSTYPLK